MAATSAKTVVRGTAELANLLVLAVFVGASAFAYGFLPDEIPVHFGASGAPDRFASTSWLSWMVLPLLAVVMTAFFYGIARLIVRIPDQLTVPDPKLYRSLSPDDQQQVVALQRPLMMEILLGVNIMFAALQWGSYQVAMGAREALPWYSWAVMTGFMVFTIIVCVKAHRRSRSLIRSLAVSDAE